MKELDAGAVEAACESLCAERKIGPFSQLWPSDQESIRAQALTAIRAYLAAAPKTEPTAGVVVKPLAWEAFWFGSDEDTRAWRPSNSIVSKSIFIITMDGDSWDAGSCNNGRHVDLATAKGAAQADYEARIRSALTAAPAPVLPAPLTIGQRVTVDGVECVVVPVVPTLKMQRAYFDEVDSNMDRVETDVRFGRFDNNRLGYRAMTSPEALKPEGE